MALSWDIETKCWSSSSVHPGSRYPWLYKMPHWGEFQKSEFETLCEIWSSSQMTLLCCTPGPPFHPPPYYRVNIWIVLVTKVPLPLQMPGIVYPRKKLLSVTLLPWPRADHRCWPSPSWAPQSIWSPNSRPFFGPSEHSPFSYKQL